MGIIYRSRRVGKFGKEFDLLKFRTMSIDGGCPTASYDDPRITKGGKFLRKYKLDELPSLFNVIRRDINLVGPRPDVVSEIETLDIKTWITILSVRPGLISPATLWDINEDEILKGKEDPHAWYCEHIKPTKYALNVWYVKNRSVWMDIKILFVYFLKIIKKEPDMVKMGILPKYDLLHKG